LIAIGLVTSIHDISIAVVADGKLLAAVELERFSRIKHHAFALRYIFDPENCYLSGNHAATDIVPLIYALRKVRKYLLDKYDIDIKDPDIIALNWKVSLEIERYADPQDRPFLVPQARQFYLYLSFPSNVVASSIHHGIESKKANAHRIDVEKKEYKKVVEEFPTYTHTHWLRNNPKVWLVKKAEPLICRILKNKKVRERCFFAESRKLKTLIKLPAFVLRRKYLLTKTFELLEEESKKRTMKLWKIAFGTTPKKVVTVKHHIAHALSAYYTSGFKKAVAIVVDGKGEWAATSVYNITDGEIETLKELIYTRYSLGVLYDYSGTVLGYDGLEGPGKIMGLAPYGRGLDKYEKFFKELVEVYSPTSEVPFKLTVPVPYIKKWWKSKIDHISWDPNGRPLNEDAIAFAWSLQKRFEEAYLTTMEWARELSGRKSAVIAGGAALNAKANMEVLYSKIFNEMFVFPASNDAGTSIGAAFYAYVHELGGTMKNERIENVFWGIEYGDEEISRALDLAKRFGYRIERDYPIENLVEDYLLKNEIITVYQGRAEFGPRALGHRSIVADPRIKENWERVNELKGREWWRPLAPSLLLEHAKDYFEIGAHLPFMIVMERFKDEETCRRVPAVCHVDMTARPQTVTESIDKNWYNLIKEFGKRTGEYIVINTSFNLGGEPLVETPAQAVVDLALGGFKALWLDGTLIYKP